MSSWSTITVEQVQPGQRVRFRGHEFTVSRVDQRFLGRDNMVCFVEDTPERWHAYPARLGDELEVLAGGVADG